MHFRGGGGRKEGVMSYDLCNPDRDRWRVKNGVFLLRNSKAAASLTVITRGGGLERQTK